MTIKDRINNYQNQDSKTKLNSWKELISICHDFINSNNKDQKLAKELAMLIYRHRGIMGSSKAYEDAFDIEIELVKLQLSIARIAFVNSEELIPFLNDAVYYASFDSDVKLKLSLIDEIKSIQSKIDENKS